MDATTSYRRRQRRRAVIAWSSVLLVAALVALGIALGGGEGDKVDASASVHLFSWEMSSTQYEQIHEGEDESLVLNRLGSVGLQEDEVDEAALLHAFPPVPGGSTCSFWKLSDAPEHLVRLCFSDPQGVLLQKVVRAPGESGGESTLS